MTAGWPRQSEGHGDPEQPNAPRRHCISTLLSVGLCGPLLLLSPAAKASRDTMLIDDFSDSDLVSKLGTRWRGVSDQVMGGLSQAVVTQEVVAGRPCLRLTGAVRLENNGGFIQAALDLSDSQGTLDASGFTGLRMTVRGNGETYGVHLRTPDVSRPWQSYRASFKAEPAWQNVDLPFEAFAPHRLSTPLDRARLRRVGFVALGRAFHADLAVAALSLYR